MALRIPALRPLRHRDFRLLWTGLAVSLAGDGLWLVALAWQVIELGGGPIQLSFAATAYSVSLLPASMALAGPAGEALGLTAVFLFAGLAPVAAAFIAYRSAGMRKDELANPV